MVDDPTDTQDPGDPPTDSDPALVLVAHEEASTTRLIRDSLLGFTRCEVDSCISGEAAFERCLQRPYRLLFISLALPVIPGELLYELISKVHRYGHCQEKLAPPVIFVGQGRDQQRVEDLRRDVRVKGVLIKPFRIDQLLKQAGQILPSKEPDDPV